MLQDGAPSEHGDDHNSAENEGGQENVAEFERLRLEQAVFSAMYDAYGAQPTAEEANRIVRVAIIRTREILEVAEREGVEVPVALVEGLNNLLPELSKNSKDSFVLGKSTICPFMKALSQSKGFEKVDFGEIENFSYLEGLMIKAAGGAKKYQQKLIQALGPALIGLTPAEVRAAFDNLLGLAKILHDVQDAHHKQKTLSTEQTESAGEQVDDLIEILEVQGFAPEEVEKKPFGIEDMIALMDLSNSWLEMNESEQAQILYNMNQIADHFGLRLVSGPRGPEIVKAEKNE